MQPTLIRPDMHYWLLRPHASLRPWVVHYFVVRPSPGSPRGSGQPELFLPDGLSELIFTVRANFKRWSLDKPDRTTLMQSSYAIGGRTHSVFVSSESHNEVIGVKLDPRFLRALIATPLSEFRDQAIALSDIGEASLVQLEQELASLTSIADIKSALDGFFMNRIRRLRIESCVDRFIKDVHRSAGALQIMRWLDSTQVDPRAFERKFCDWMGMTPKKYARLVRFRTSYSKLTSLGGRVCEHLDNYYDQSHFHRDFKYFTGVAPIVKLRGLLDDSTRISDHLLSGV
jgi:AraC-like DNA-binding protein